MMRTIRNAGNRRPASAQAPIRTRARGVDLATLALGAALVALLALLAPAAHAQGSRKDDIVFGPGGHPVAGATVTVCQASATGTPCTPLATLYTDATLTVPAANPLQTDGIGNYHFYAAAGRYVVQVSGPGISGTLTYRDVILASDVSSSGSGNNISAFGLTLGGNLSVAGNAAVNGTLAVGGSTTFSGPLNINAANTGNVAGKSALADAVQYVTPEGNDANDGLSWGTAKFTVFGACEALPGGAASPPTCGAGTIYFIDLSHANPTANAGFWLMGGNDPNYASPPAGWLRATSSGDLALIGIGKSGSGPNPHKPRAVLVGGGQADRNHPGVWLSSISGAVYIANVAVAYPARAYVVGECSNNTRTSTCNTSGVTFENTTGNLNAVAGNGPCFDITGASFWIWLRDWACSGLDNVNTTTDDKSAALLIDGRGNSGVGLIFVEDGNTAYGGIKFYAGINSGGLSVNGLTTEAQQGEPAVWMAVSGQAGDNGAVANISNVQVADATNNPPAFQNDIPGIAGQVLVAGTQFGAVIGPATVMNQYGPTVRAQTISPLRQGQTGFINGHIFGATDLTARQFAPSAVRFTNLAKTDATTWTNSGSTTFTTGITAPDGTTGAGQFVSTSGVQEGFVRPGTNMTLAAGDYFVAGVWVRSQTANGYANAGVPIQIFQAGGTSTCTYNNWVVAGDGQWDWVTGICKVLTVPANPYFPGLQVIYNTTHTLQVYGPVLVYIPAGTISENEVYAYAAALVPYDKTCPVGSACNLATQSLYIPGNVLFPGLLTSGTIANSLCTDSTGHVIANSAANCYAGGSGTVTTSGSPAQYQVSLFSSATAITGVAPTANSQCFMSAASNYATTNPLFATCPSGGSGLSGMTAGQIPVAASATTVTSSIATSGSGSVCLTTSCVMTTPNLGTPSAINLTNATSPPTWNQSTTGTAVGISGALFLSNTPLSILGDTMYVNSSPALERLAGNATSTKKFLTQTGTGSASAAPAWGVLASGDIPSNAANTSGTAATITGALALANTPLTTTQDILYDNAGSLARLPIVTSGTCLGNTAGSWAALACSGGGMVYPGAGVANSTGSAWGTSYTVGTALNNLVQLNGSAQLPAVSAALLTNFPTLNQNTTGSAAFWTTARNLAGNSVDGSANVAFANKFIVQGTTDAGLSGPQFLGALGTGIVKNTTTTGVLSIATGSDLPAAIPIASVGSAGLSGTSPISISAPGAISIAGAAGEILAGATPALTFTPTLGISGTAGTLAMFPASGNFTTTWGSAATASNTILGFATAPTTGDLASCTTSGTICTLTDAGVLAANVVTAASAAGAANQVAISSAASKALTYVTADSTTTHALFATAGAPAFRALASGDIPSNAANTSGTAANLSGTPALPNGTTATTQAAASNDTKLATDAYVDNHFIANGTAVLNTAAVGSGACETVVTVAATGVATTDVIGVGFNGDPTAVTGYGASATGAVLSIYAYPTSGNVNVKVCNSTSASITPSAMTLNWKVTR